MKRHLFFITFFFLIVSLYSYSNTNKYRLTYHGDPSNSIVVGWRQSSGSNPVVYYGTTDHGINWQNYSNSHSVDRNTSRKGMDHKFSRLTNLTPNTIYYFVIKDTDGTSNRYSFKTLSNDPNVPLSIIAGGDSRTNRGARQNANKLVAKLRPDFVYFGGDYTELNFDSEWKNWFDDWQLTISSDGRMYPIVAARGNHEWSNNDIYDMFDTPHPDVYYAQTFGGGLLRAYTLNSEMAIPGDQTNWLINDLQNNQTNIEWRIAQYHKPMRPHVASKSEGNDQYIQWAQAFYDYNVQLAVECDAHTVKSTWPVMPSTSTNSEEGFIQTNVGGTTYVGEGCWGAPLRAADDNKSWTRDSDVFNSFQWLKITKEKITLKFIKTDSVTNVGIVDDNNRFDEPANLAVWSPTNGAIVCIENVKYIQRPSVNITAPNMDQGFNSPQVTTFSANALDSNGTIEHVKFYVNDVLVGTDSIFPYEMQWNIPLDGEYVLTAWAKDNDGYENISEEVNVYVGTINITAQINQSSDDAEEQISSGAVDITSSDIEMIEENNTWPVPDEDQIIGLRFKSISIPTNATILNSYIQFTAKEDDNDACNLTIYGEKTISSETFKDINNNISQRPKTTANIGWIPNTWNNNDQGNDQQTPQLNTIINEIITQPNWKAGNPITFIIEGSSGTRRSAVSYDGFDLNSPKLIIEFRVDELTETVEIPISKTNISVFPNPFKDQITVNWEKQEDKIDISLFNSNGTLIKQWTKNNMSSSNLLINDSIPKGVYFLKLTSVNIEKTIKILKQ